MQVGPVKALLELRERWAGPAASFTTNRFLYETVGQLHYIRWTPQDGHKVRLAPLLFALRVRPRMWVFSILRMHESAAGTEGRLSSQACAACVERERGSPMRARGRRASAGVGEEHITSVQPNRADRTKPDYDG